MGLRERTARSIRSTFLGAVGAALFQVITLIVLAHLISPIDYGKFAGASIIISIVQRGVLSPLERAIVVSGGRESVSVQSIQGLALVTMLCAACLFSFCGLVAGYFYRSSIGFTLAGASWVLPASACLSPMRAIHRLNMSFDRLVRTDLVAQFVGSTITPIALALLGMKSNSLVLGSLVVVSIQVAGYKRGLANPIRFNFSLSEAWPLLATALRVARFSVLELFQGQVPSIFVGSMLGLAPLGLYNRASSMVQMPLEMMTTSISQVVYSSVVQIRHEPARLASGMYQVLEAIVAITFPIACGMAIAAPQLVDVILGKKWITSEPFIVWLTLGSSMCVVGSFVSVVLESTLFLTARAYAQLASLVSSIVLFLILARYGLIYACIAFALTWLVYLVVQLSMAIVLLQLDLLKVFRAMLPGCVGALLVWVFIFSMQIYLAHVSQIALLAIEVAGSATILGMVLAVFFRRYYSLLLAIFS
jgi:lipopolysaccharide exporter